MHYTSTLETLESFSSALSRFSEDRVGAWAILYSFVTELGRSSCPWLKLVVLGIAHGSREGTLFTLSILLSLPYRWITRVL